MRSFYVFLCIAGLAGTTVTGSSCNVINPEEVVPTYVHIDSFTFTPNPLLGSNSNRITSVYVYFDNAPVGVFDIPATFPVMATRPGTITVLPAVDYSGLSGYQAIYPFYTSDTLLLTPAPGGTVNYTPTTSYMGTAMPRFHDDFEKGSSSDNEFMKLSGDAALATITTPSEVFEGAGSGLIHLPPGKDSATLISRSGRYVPIGKSAFIELNYRSNIPLLVGMNVDKFDGSSTNRYILGLKPREEWGKIYIGISDFINANQGPAYRILLYTQKPEDVSDGYVYIDNIKVVSF